MHLKVILRELYKAGLQLNSYPPQAISSSNDATYAASCKGITYEVSLSNIVLLQQMSVYPAN